MCFADIFKLFVEIGVHLSFLNMDRPPLQLIGGQNCNKLLNYELSSNTTFHDILVYHE
jgi:hypothetical protein